MSIAKSLMDFDDSPRANASSQEVLKRHAALSLPHMQPLADYVAELRRRYPTAEVPDFDPMGGGINADMLFLGEKPGPKTSRLGCGSGLISICNDDPSAEHSWRFMKAAGIENSRTVRWNVIPYWDGSIKTRSVEMVRQGIHELERLIVLLPKVKVACLAGKHAHKAERLFDKVGIPVVKTCHPGMIARNSIRERWEQIPVEWTRARELADGV